MDLEADLKKEIEKWSLRLEEELKKSEIKDDHFRKNIHAYVQDSAYFERKGDLIKAFEALIWAWAYLEIYREMKD